ncbi:MAG: PAS domain S-box protein [Ruminococcaceae bacterium]|nr:PAS domain S-box protein [Oscillospiraceae bacterium]
MNCVVDKADNLKVISSDSHFSDFTGVHPSKIKQGKLYLNDIINPRDRENVRRVICKKDSPYVYLDFYIKDKSGEEVFVHCTGYNIEGTKRCRLTLADISRSQKKSEELKTRADEMKELVDLVNAGVCLFKVTSDMEFIPLYMNKTCCEMFGTSKSVYAGRKYRLDDLIHEGDKSAVFQAVGKAMATKKPIDMEIRVLTHRNSVLWCKFGASVHRYDDDGCPVFHGIFSDINDVKMAEEDADSERDLLVRIFKNLPGALFTADFNAPFMLDVVSSDFIKLIGYSRKEFFENYGGDLTKLMVQKEVPVARHSLVVSAEGKTTANATYSLKTKSGKHLIVVDRRRIVERENGEKASIGILRDVTAQSAFETLDI